LGSVPFVFNEDQWKREPEDAYPIVIPLRDYPSHMLALTPPPLPLFATRNRNKTKQKICMLVLTDVSVPLHSYDRKKMHNKLD
jgi:hypothetical protein